MPTSIASYKKLRHDFDKVGRIVRVYLLAAEDAYTSQFGSKILHKEPIIERLHENRAELLSIYNQLRKFDVKGLTLNHDVEQDDVMSFVASLGDLINTTAMSITILKRRPSRTLVFTNPSGFTDFVFNFDM